jgi:hypothetical protein
MGFATGGFHGLSYVPEVTMGVTPGTPSMKTVRHTSCSLGLTKESFQSNELRSDRQISDLRHGAKKVEGEVAFELSYGAFDDLLAAAFFGAWNTDVLKAGTTYQSFTMERRFTDIIQYQTFTGVLVDSMSLNITPNGMITGSFGLVGMGTAIAGTSLGTPAAAAANSPFDGFGGALKEGGTTIAAISAITLELQNSLDPFFALGSDSAVDITAGRCQVSGTVSAAFANVTLLNKFILETESSLEVELSDPLGNSLTILLPRIKYSGGDIPAQNEGRIVMNMPFTALLDSVSGTNIQLTRDAV